MVLGARELNTSQSSCPFEPSRFQEGQFDDQCSMLHFWSPHTGGSHFAFADGSVRFLRYSAADRAGGEVVAVPE